MAAVSFASQCLDVWRQARNEHPSEPVRWWLREEDWERLRAETYIAQPPPTGPWSKVFMALPVAIDWTDQPSRLILDDGTAVPIATPPSPSSAR